MCPVSHERSAQPVGSFDEESWQEYPSARVEACLSRTRPIVAGRGEKPGVCRIGSFGRRRCVRYDDPMRVELVERPGEEWDQFAEAHPDGRLGHAAAWAPILEAAYGLKPHYLAARAGNGDLVGLLPLVALRSRPGGKQSLISLPFLDSAGILASNPEVEAALLAHATSLTAEGGSTGLELRQAGAWTGSGAVDAGSEASMDRVNLVLPLKSSDESQWTALSAKVRNQCRKAEREGLTLAAGDASALLHGFLLPYRINMRDLGSPPHSAAFFDALARHFGDRVRFVVTQHARLSVGGLVAIRFGRRVYVPWASTLRSERNRCPNNQIYWEAIRWAIETGATEFDFGRSPQDAGTYRFKKGWGAVEEVLAWHWIDAAGHRTSRAAGTDNPIVRRLSRIWTRLPVSVATALGSRLRRYFSN